MSRKNKEDWGPGPWQNEPDDKDWVDPATMLDCKILRGPFGALCGYVGVPKEHPAYGMSYSFYIEGYVDENVEWWRRHITHRVEYKIMDIDVHGGLTFSGPHTDSDLHWFGFDCSHAFDFTPGLLDGETLQHIRMKDEIYRDIEYVTTQVESLAKQLAAIKRLDDGQTGTS